LKQEDRRLQTTQLILETTKQLIREKGCETLTMKDIMEGSGLSKGAIFHYVKTKDEIYAWVLKERNEIINKSFMGEVNLGKKEFEGPMQKIADMLQNLEDPHDVSNKVLKYLLGKEDQPAVADVLQEFYEQTIRYSKQWILTGQQYGVIPATIDANKTADLFVLISLGLRVRSSLTSGPLYFNVQDFLDFLADTLKSRF
jgi:AcrR family transcriptional regulator